MTRREVALALALTALGVWLLWAGRQEGGPRTVLATTWLWWWAALQATWRVWLPAGVVLAGLSVALPPRVPRRGPLRRGSRFLGPSPEAVPLIAPASIVAAQEPDQEPIQETPQVSVPASVPAPARTVWDAFAPLHQERDDGAAT